MNLGIIGQCDWQRIDTGEFYLFSLFGDGGFDGFGPSVFMPRGYSSTEGFALKNGPVKLRKHIRIHVPKAPGVYGLLDSAGIVFYVGKAKSLRRRLLSYFLRKKSKEKRLLSRTRGLYWQTCPTDFHALLRESELINSFLPAANVLGVAQRLSPCFLVVSKDEAPALKLCKKPPRVFLECVGPFHRSKFLLRCVEVLRDVFRLRDCADRKNWNYIPRRQLKVLEGVFDCIRFDLGRCAGPCAWGCTKKEYGGLTKSLLEFLRDGNNSCLSALKERMHQVARLQQFELAQTIKTDLEMLERLDVILKKRRTTFFNAVFFQKLSDSKMVMNVISNGCLARSEIVEEVELQRLKELPKSHWIAADEVALRPWGHFERVLVSKWLKKNPQNQGNWIDLGARP